jgi:hypothetical protein
MQTERECMIEIFLEAPIELQIILLGGIICLMIEVVKQSK